MLHVIGMGDLIPFSTSTFSLCFLLPHLLQYGICLFPIIFSLYNFVFTFSFFPFFLFVSLILCDLMINSKVIMDPGYKKTITPIPEDGTDGDLCVNVSLSILDILQIDEMKETFTAKISLRREWMDRRLTYKNLKRENSNKNDLSTKEAESIWYPSMSINNVENQEKVKPTDIEHHARVIPDQNFSYTSKNNRHFFKGSENKLTLTKQWTVEFVCHYELHWYPFDTQVIFTFYSTLPTGRVYKLKFCLSVHTFQHFQDRAFKSSQNHIRLHILYIIAQCVKQ